MVQKLLEKVDDKDLIEDSSWILLDSAKLAEGLEPKDKSTFAKRVAKLLTRAI